ncbi:MAG: TatD family hydrolase [Woeseiaceae bacterium]
MNSLVDIGANLTHDSFDADRNEVIRRAREAGVDCMIITGSSAQGSRDAVALAESHPDMFRATAGVHPHHASEYDDEVHDVLQELLGHPLVVAVGECGLDYFRDFSPRDAQRTAFERQIELGIASQLPLFLHQRDAHEDFVSLLRPVRDKIAGAVAHCFTGGTSELRAYVDMGLYIGVTGWICDERRGAALYEAVKSLPLDRLMIETDAPYLMPRTLNPKPKSRRNEPQYLPEVLRVVAAAMQLPVDTVARASSENAKRFFRI